MEYNWEQLLTVSTDELPWSDYNDIQKQATEAKKIVSTVQRMISEAAAQYKKKKLKARSKAQANDMALMFADLEPYQSIEQIREAYGWELITDTERAHLMELWELREKTVAANGKYRDAVTDVLDTAIRNAYAPYVNLLEVAERMAALIEERKKESLRQEIAFQREMYLQGLQQELTSPETL